ncbi:MULTISPECIES: hypothetical protein [unclassified Bradyrhizobium]|uniref:hypothetical protein n=1 Tax=unclassified Bradyrhizobium TaxID=2631580 RepID=UPI0024788C49|nr:MULTISPECIES: hypothetical protein [unclassified Bradyrhizobium]WGR73868.1 hypothetical protein MTX24_14090 [Bradyrhizobium sp. ISRA426]WGR78705.1 hypothetical protein MTX21_39060 [Bradyrhizobium sp. ISRA430]WGR89107.1 hypothetical protein MTX25_14105 [Bradyrhizobium sp. ISRA432]
MAGLEPRRIDEVDALPYLVSVFMEDREIALICFITLFLLGGAAVLLTAKTTYSSKAMLSLTPYFEALIKTETVLDPVLQNPSLIGSRPQSR